MNTERKKIPITMGDPSGIGPEIIVKALTRKEIYQRCIPIVIGDKEALADAIKFCNLSLRLREVTELDEGKGEYGAVEYINLNLLKKAGWQYKKNSALCGEASFQYIVRAIKEALNGKTNAVVTAPISKESINLAGHKYCGHTEIFADYTDTKDYAMMLICDRLRVIHVSTHCSLRDACNSVKKGRILTVIELAYDEMKKIGIDNPKIGVAGLNPHCSEGGLFGNEESEEIIPAINEAKKRGICVFGPEPADVIYQKGASGTYDVIVAMYHDQGHIPIKMLGFKEENGQYKTIRGVNCTVGLPIIRVSVDHGTAYGKAGEGRANEDSMIEAIMTATKIVN